MTTPPAEPERRYGFWSFLIAIVVAALVGAIPTYLVMSAHMDHSAANQPAPAASATVTAKPSSQPPLVGAGWTTMPGARALRPQGYTLRFTDNAVYTQLSPYLPNLIRELERITGNPYQLNPHPTGQHYQLKVGEILYQLGLSDCGQAKPRTIILACGGPAIDAAGMVTSGEVWLDTRYFYRNHQYSPGRLQALLFHETGHAQGLGHCDAVRPLFGPWPLMCGGMFNDHEIAHYTKWDAAGLTTLAINGHK